MEKMCVCGGVHLCASLCGKSGERVSDGLHDDLREIGKRSFLEIYKAI